MGISRGASKLIASALGGSAPRGRAITFGVQRVETDDGGHIHQDELFGRLGFGRVESIDYYPDEKPTHVLDLNLPVPVELRGQLDLVSDRGTMGAVVSAPPGRPTA